MGAGAWGRRGSQDWTQQSPWNALLRAVHIVLGAMGEWRRGEWGIEDFRQRSGVKYPSGHRGCMGDI